MPYNKYFGLLPYFQGLQSLENVYLAYINENLYNSVRNSVILVGQFFWVLTDRNCTFTCKHEIFCTF